VANTESDIGPLRLPNGGHGMSQLTPTSERFLRRLAGGVPRTRLVDPIVAARPPFVVVGAPSGYGKTALAAQLAVSGAYDSTLWVDGRGDCGSLGHALAGLLDCLSDRELDCTGWAFEDILQSCAMEIRALPGDATLLIVLDAVDGPLASGELDVIASMAMEAPVGSTVILTTKALASGSPSPDDAWLIDAAMLRLDEAETAEMWCLHHGGASHGSQDGALAEMSGCHAALASLIARRAALLGHGAGIEPQDSLSTQLIRGLASSQLNETELAVLGVAAIAREGTSGFLGACLCGADVGPALARIAEVLPLVSVTGCGAAQRFAVSGLVTVALGGPSQLAQSAPEVAARLVRELVRAGRGAEALSIAVQSDLPALLVETLRAVGAQLLAGPAADLVAESLASVSTAIISIDPFLLILVAESEWHDRQPSRALASARIALSLAQHSHDERGVLKAQLAAARFRWSMGDFDGIAGELAPLVLRWKTFDDLDDVCSLLTSAEIALAFAGDREGLTGCRVIARELSTRDGVRESALSRLREVDGIVTALVDGDYLLGFQKCESAAVCRHSSIPRRVSVQNNMASLALMSGLLDEANAAAEAGQSLLRAPQKDSAASASLEAVRALASGLRSGSTGVRAALDRAVEAESADGDKFGLVSALTLAAPATLALGERSLAVAYADRAVSVAVDTGSPVVRWQAQLVHAMCSLAVDDIDRARATATRVLPEVEAIGAMAHVLHARMILAELALRDDDLATAVQHLSDVSAYVIEASPALMVACYLRTFPTLLGPLALAMGVDAIPVRVLGLLHGRYRDGALEAAAAVLTKPELNRLKRRMRQETERTAACERAESGETALCEVRLLGGFEVRAPHGVVADRDWVKRKARLLFAILVAKGGTDIARGEIIDHLWPDMDEKRGLSNFYVVWSAMKRALSPGGSRDQASPFVEHNRGVCRIVPGRVVSDLEEFKAALGQARTAHAAGDARGELAALLEALRLYRGDVLPGDVYDDWFAPIRERFKHDYEDTALRIGRLYADAGELLEALSVLRDASGRNPWREDIYQAILRLQIASGQRAAAIETYFMCRSRLVEDLGIDPSRETTALYEQVLGMDEHTH
jgi:DNA-binding SARP family transcriptional activator